MRLRVLLREPLVHFAALGALIFGVSEWTGGGAGVDSRRIVVTTARIEHLAAGFARTWSRAPTEDELKALLDDYVREEIATREARSMGLDRDDAIVRRRLRQKLEFLLEDANEAAAPLDEELDAWLRAHPDAFRREPQVAFRQVYLSPTRRREATATDADALLERLRAQGPEAAIETLGDRIQLPQELELQPRGEVARVFGPEFAVSVCRLEEGLWSGPIVSGFGWHLVLVRQRVEGTLPELDEVRSEVLREFLAEGRKRRLQALYDRFLERYDVVIERPSTEGDTEAESR